MNVNLRILLIRNALAELTWMYIRAVEMADLSGDVVADHLVFTCKTYSQSSSISSP